MPNTNAIWQQATHTHHLPTIAQQEPYKNKKTKSLLPKKKETFLEKVRRMDHQQKNDKTERAAWLGGKTRDREGE